MFFLKKYNYYPTIVHEGKTKPTHWISLGFFWGSSNPKLFWDSVEVYPPHRLKCHTLTPKKKSRRSEESLKVVCQPLQRVWRLC